MGTRHLDAAGKPKYSNRLVNDSSPYLVQHAHNPVDWYPWGEEAFKVAAAEDKPIFLSIGYSTCHWCHVMERESFDDETIADYLNQHFVSIKLDREQRPDLDEIYMTGLQLMTGQGGWPMSNFMTPEAKPFFAGTYFPAEAFLNLLQEITAAWNDRRSEVVGQAEQLFNSIEKHSATREQAKIDDSVIERARERLLASYDPEFGGFGRAPKFPNESQLWLLYHDRGKTSASSQQAMLHTLRQMAGGGIFDQIGGGFHRYSVDTTWLVPHFEKMLYNQGQLLRLYAAGYQLSGDPLLLRTVEYTIAYLEREMIAEDGEFYSASDADTEGQEGKFFVWSYDELNTLLTESELALAKLAYGVTKEGNFEGANLLFAADFDVYEARKTELTLLRDKLLRFRDQREKPFVDQKILAGWNGLLISSIAQIELLTGLSGLRVIAHRAAESIWRSHVDQPEGEQDGLVLLRSKLGHQVSVRGTLEDYAFLADAFLHLALLDGQGVWLNRAESLIAAMIGQFWDKDSGGFFISAGEQEGPMIVRSRHGMDTAMPSPNSMALSALILAYEATGKLAYKQRVDELIAVHSGTLAENPVAYPFMLTQIDRYWHGSKYLIQWACGGRVWIALKRRGTEAYLEIKVTPGWHLNHPDTSADSGLIGLMLKGASMTSWPPPKLLDVSFDETKVPVLEGAFEIALTAIEGEVEVTLQLCSDELCLAPDIVRLPDVTAMWASRT